MRRVFIAFVATFICVIHAFAVPAEHVEKKVEQADGSLLTIVLNGDENFAYYTTTDGVPVVENNGSYYLAEWSAEGLIASEILAHDAMERGGEEQNYISENGTSVRNQIASVWGEKLQKANMMHSAKLAYRAEEKPSGRLLKASAISRKALVILVNFKDQSFKSTSTQSEISAMMNQEGYNKNGHIGSVHDYFYDQSYGAMNLQLDVVGPVTLSQNMSYYGAVSGSKRDVRAGTMVAEACKLVDSQVDFSSYDWYSDGEVELIYVIYAGYAQSAGANSNTIWPHASLLSGSDYGSELTLDGVVVNTYACSSELSGTSGSTLSGIGTPCHELSHCFGLCDLYDTSGNNNFGMNTWSIMDRGCYNANGKIPCGYTAFERNYAGWMTSNTLVTLKTETSVANMKPLSEFPGEAYKIYNDASSWNECFILENRQQTGWDSGCSGHGLLITHLDYDGYSWAYDHINTDPSRQRFTIMPADNEFSTTAAGLAGDPYPGTKGNTSFTDTSVPASKFYEPTKSGSYYLGKPITNIKENSDGTISFDFMKTTEEGGGSSTEESLMLSRSGWSAKADGYASSGYDGSPSYAFDGSLNTHWHSRYDSSGGGSTNYELPHYIQFDLGSVQEFSAFNYVSRTANGSQNGDVANYEIYISNSDMTTSLGSGYVPTGGTKIKSGTFTYNNSREHYTELGANYSARYLFLLCKSTANNTKFSACSEFYLYNTPSSGGDVEEEEEYCTPSVATQGTSKQYVGQIVTLTTTGADVNASWTNPKTESYNGCLQPIENTFTAHPGQSITLNIIDKNTTWGLVRVYADLNGNFTFDSNEQIFADADRNRTTSISQSFTLSSNIVEGDYLIRVMYVAGSNEKSQWACDNYTEGGYYDFYFTVKAAGTSIEEIEAEQVRVYATENSINICTESEYFTPIFVYNSAGVMVAQSYTSGGEVRIQTSSKGLFIVKVGEQVYKVVK